MSQWLLVCLGQLPTKNDRYNEWQTIPWNASGIKPLQWLPLTLSEYGSSVRSMSSDCSLFSITISRSIPLLQETFLADAGPSFTTCCWTLAVSGSSDSQGGSGLGGLLGSCSEDVLWTGTPWQSMGVDELVFFTGKHGASTKLEWFPLVVMGGYNPLERRSRHFLAGTGGGWEGFFGCILASFVLFCSASRPPLRTGA